MANGSRTSRTRPAGPRSTCGLSPTRAASTRSRALGVTPSVTCRVYVVWQSSTCGSDATLIQLSLRLERRQLPLVAPPRGELRFAEPPGDIERRFAAALGQLAMLSLMVVEPAQAEPVPRLVAAPSRPIYDVMVLDRAACRAAGCHARVAVALVDGVTCPLRK